MFVISQKTSYKWPVSIEVPSDGGKWDKQTFDAEFKKLPQSVVEKILAGDEKGNVNYVDFARQMFVGWSGINNEAGEEVPFSEAQRDALLEIPMLAVSLCTAYLESLQGAKRKN